LADQAAQALFQLRPSAWLNRLEYLFLLAVLALLWFAYDTSWALGGTLLIRHRASALLLVADSFESPAEHARFRRHLLRMLENHAC